MLQLSRLLPLCARGWLGDLLAIVAGALITLSLAPFDIWPLAILAAALAYLLLQSTSAARSAWRGWLLGLGLFASGVSWVYVSIHDYGNAAPWLAGLLTGGFVAGLALFPALYAWLWSRFIRQQQLGLHNALAFAAFWVAGEAFRGWFLTGFPWLYLGYSQLDGPLRALAPVGGVWLLSFALALSAALLANLLSNSAVRKRWPLHIAVLVPLWLIAGTLQLVSWTSPAGSALTVVAIQGNVEQNLKWEPQHINQQLRLYQQMTEQAPKADLLVWPENAIPVLQTSAADYLAYMDHLARQQHSALLTGIPVVQHNAAGQRRFYNGILGLGEASGEYLKQQLVPFGEYVPLQDQLRGLIEFFDLPMSDFARGPANQPPLRVKEQRIAPSICYEVVYPELVRKLAAKSEILLTISNDTWFGTSIGPLQHLQMAQMRALEAGRWMIRATNNGVTALIDPQGRIDTRVPQFALAVLQGEVVPMQGLTPYLRFGSYPLAVVCLLLLGWACYRRRD